MTPDHPEAEGMAEAVEGNFTWEEGGIDKMY